MLFANGSCAVQAAVLFEIPSNVCSIYLLCIPDAQHVHIVIEIVGFGGIFQPKMKNLSLSTQHFIVGGLGEHFQK